MSQTLRNFNVDIVFKPFMRVLLAVLMFGTLTACKPPSNNQLKVTLENQTISVGPNTIAFLVEQNGKPVMDAVVAVSGDMTHPGMAPVVGTAISLGDGRYQLQNFDISMGGDWVLSVVAKKSELTLKGSVPFSVQTK